jgi:hypothetical protein
MGLSPVIASVKNFLIYRDQDLVTLNIGSAAAGIGGGIELGAGAAKAADLAIRKCASLELGRLGSSCKGWCSRVIGGALWGGGSCLAWR